MSSRYVELRTHTAFSFGDGSCSPEALVRRATELGYGALGLTDHADLGGIVRFALEAERLGVSAVIGAELLVDGYPTAFLARDAEGYRNLAGLITRARVGGLPSPEEEGTAERDSRSEARALPPSLSRDVSRSRGRDPLSSWAGAEQARGRPGVTWTEVEERSEGLWALTGPAAGEIPSLIRARRPDEAIFALERWKAVFAQRLAVEVQLHRVSGEEAALAEALIGLADRGRVPWVVANDPRYLDGASGAHAGGRLVHDLLVANRAGVDVSTAASWGLLLPNGEWKLKSPAEMSAMWRERDAGLAVAHEIALDCDFHLNWVRPPLPHFPVPRGQDDDSWLRELTYRGARERWSDVDERQRAQLDHELRVIRKLGFAGFFLVMWDAVRFAREQGILCQGRGSAANSAVAYCLGITAVDPVRHGLLFERFLSEVRTDGRTEAPDIDVDFEMHRREEVLDYMYRTYARGNAAITAVTQAYHAPAAIQDCMRALGYPAQQAFLMSKRLHGAEPSEGAAAIEAGLAREAGVDLGEPRGHALLSALRALDDVPRLRSTHPGGFVLSSQPLGDFMPIEETTMGRTIVQFDKDDLDSAGVPKFDFLGLGGLSAVHLAFDAIEQRTGEKLELYRLPTDDVATYEMISVGDTVGTFQIESRAQIQSILQTRPERLYDIVVQVALIRPGPIQAKFVHPYTRRRRGRENVTYAHPLLEPILRRTYGIPIFQEQAMAISMALGGFSAAEADELRRAMGHFRKVDRLLAVLERLRGRIVQHTGLGDEAAAGIVEDLQSFANYGFPESHAWSFALIAYATAYLKAHFPTEFFLGMLNAWPMGFYPPATLVHDALRHGVVVLPPCMKDGQWDCTLEPAPRSGVGDSPHSHPHSKDLAEATMPAVTPEYRDSRGIPESAERPDANADAHADAGTSERPHPGAGAAPAALDSDSDSPARTSRSAPVISSGLTPASGSRHTIALRVGWRHIRGLG